MNVLKSNLKQHQLALVTAPSMTVARRLARAVLNGRLAACANLVPGLESRYWWKGKLEKSSEVLLIFKTRQPLLKPLLELVTQLHPYDTPEFVVLPVSAASTKYLAWWNSETCPGNAEP